MGLFSVLIFYIGMNLLLAFSSAFPLGYCPGDNEGSLKCCIHYRRKDNKCIECEIGTYGNNCSLTCANGRYGRLCIKRCSCPQEFCNHVTGCTSTVGNEVTRGCISYENTSNMITGPPLVISSTQQNSYTDGKIKVLKLTLISHPPPENVVSVEFTNGTYGKLTYPVSAVAALVKINVYGRQYSVPGYAVQIELRASDISWTGIYNIGFVSIFGRSVHYVFLREIVDETNTTPSPNITQMSSAEDMESGLEKFISKYWVFMTICAGGSVATCFTIAISMQIRKCVKIKNVQVYSAPIPNNMELRDVKEERQYDTIIDDCVGTSNDTIENDEGHYNIIEYRSSTSSYEEPV